MKRRKRAALVSVVALLLALTARPQEAARTFKLSGRLLGSSGTHVIYVALWQADGFLKRPIQQLRIEVGAQRVFRFEIPAGNYAVSAFEDSNNNGTLDAGLFGPKEPNGFWRAFAGHHKPRFEEVASFIDRDTTNADIVIK